MQGGHAPRLWSCVRVSPVQQTCSVYALVLQLHLSASVCLSDSTSAQVRLFPPLNGLVQWPNSIVTKNLKSNLVPGQTSLSFSGNSYIKYRVSDSGQNGEMKLSLKIRTLQRRGVIMYTRVNPCTMLKVGTVRVSKSMTAYMVKTEFSSFSLLRSKGVDSGFSWTVTTPLE